MITPLVTLVVAYASSVTGRNKATLSIGAKSAVFTLLEQLE